MGVELFRRLVESFLMASRTVLDGLDMRYEEGKQCMLLNLVCLGMTGQGGLKSHCWNSQRDSSQWCRCFMAFDSVNIDTVTPSLLYNLLSPLPEPPIEPSDRLFLGL